MTRAKENFDYMIDFVTKVTGLKDEEKIDMIKQQLLMYTSIQNIEYSIMFNEVKKMLESNAT